MLDALQAWLNRIKTVGTAPAANETHAAHLVLEGLEDRWVLSAVLGSGPQVPVTGQLGSDGVLTIQGTAARDVITIDQSGGKLLLGTVSVLDKGQMVNAIDLP